MKLSASGLAFLTKEEGIRRQVYNDATGKTISSYSDPGLKINGGTGYPTIGLGLALLSSDLRSRYAPYLGGGRAMSDSELNASIQEAIAPRERSVSAMLKRAVTQAQFDMLFSFYYNRGASSGFKTAVAALNAGDAEGAARAIAAAGERESVPHIAERRLREAAQFLAGSAAGIGSAGIWIAGGAAVLVLIATAVIVRRKRQRSITVQY
jgi:GH24 family phage-related lysozyme (muramidase)